MNAQEWLSHRPEFAAADLRWSDRFLILGLLVPHAMLAILGLVMNGCAFALLKIGSLSRPAGLLADWLAWGNAAAFDTSLGGPLARGFDARMGEVLTAQAEFHAHLAQVAIERARASDLPQALRGPTPEIADLWAEASQRLEAQRRLWRFP